MGGHKQQSTWKCFIHLFQFAKKCEPPQHQFDLGAVKFSSHGQIACSSAVVRDGKVRPTHNPHETYFDQDCETLNFFVSLYCCYFSLGDLSSMASKILLKLKRMIDLGYVGTHHFHIHNLRSVHFVWTNFELNP